ncbi:MAG TPA: DUF4126 domain-containing protein [Gammaproteobacteria bacterium]|nr:DUF4126 domain-containing protein [Gammaproteobacteria bacterium]
MNAVDQIALSMGAAWGSGINLYATILVLGYMGMTGQVQLPPELMVLSNPLVIGAAGLMYAVEFFADKTPGVDTAWDAIHTFIRIPAGALLASAALTDMGPAAELAGMLVGGGLAAATHATKAGSRVIINTSPEPFTNWTASVGEDVVVIAGVWASLQHPWWFLGVLVLFILLMIWLLPRIWRALKWVFYKLGKLFGRKAPEPPPINSLQLPGLNKSHDSTTGK